MKAIALISGGLDSTLATRLTRDLGVELVALNTLSPFCLCNHRSAKGCYHGAANVARELGLALISINVAEEFLQIVRQPKHGYGSQMNPCIDCRILLFKKAREEMQKQGAAFVITGEVLGQRPMSQKLNTMRLIEKESGLEGLVLRPLSARVLEPTLAESRGWVARDRLLAISGRGRREQIALAGELGINDYPCPSGGCLLTDPQFARRLKDLMRYEELSLEGVNLLKLGRHFRLSPAAKLVVGRDEAENGKLLGLARDQDYLFMPTEKAAGPTCLGRGDFSRELIELSCRICCRYCDQNGAAPPPIIYKSTREKEANTLEAAPLAEEALRNLRV